MRNALQTFFILVSLLACGSRNETAVTEAPSPTPQTPPSVHRNLSKAPVTEALPRIERESSDLLFAMPLGEAQIPWWRAYNASWVAFTVDPVRGGERAAIRRARRCVGGDPEQLDAVCAPHRLLFLMQGSAAPQPTRPINERLRRSHGSACAHEASFTFRHERVVVQVRCPTPTARSFQISHEGQPFESFRFNNLPEGTRIELLWGGDWNFDERPEWLVALQNADNQLRYLALFQRNARFDVVLSAQWSADPVRFAPR